MNDNKNTFIAILLCVAGFFAWQYFIATPQMKAQQARQHTLAHPVKHAPAPGAPANLPAATGSTAQLGREAALKAGGARVPILTPMVDGSLLLKGARFDDLRLRKYRETIDPKSPEIVLLAPQRTAYPYYAEFGWLASGKVPVPDENSQWNETAGGTLSPGHPVTLSWDNGHGLVFNRTVSVDDQYMFTVSDKVMNKSGKAITLYPYAYVARDGVPASKTRSSWYIHEGFVGVAGGSEQDATYDDFKDGKPPKTFNSTGGWVGITDKYWMAAVIPPQNQAFAGSYRGTPLNSRQAYQADYRLDPHTVAAGGTAQVTQRLFAGAKVVKIVNHYADSLGIVRFDLAVDWGYLWFFTKPMFWLLDWFYTLVGNFGVAIILLTITVKAIFFPLANTSYKSMSKMKKLQPQVEALKQRHGDDRVRQQQEMMELYKREKVNPVSGCLPMLIQIPVFFSLYKVLYVSIEMRHAPFFGWIHDLSAPDPTSVFNLFGLLPWHVAVPGFLAFLSIGAWPVLMGISQFLSTKLNPAPSDPMQARMFALMPLIFTFMMAGFPAGLVVYWTVSNLLSAAQQYTIMRRQGVKVDFLENLRLKPKPKPAP